MMMMIMIMWTKQRTKRTDNNSGESLLLYTLAPTEVTVLRVSKGVTERRVVVKAVVEEVEVVVTVVLIG